MIAIAAAGFSLLSLAVVIASRHPSGERWSWHEIAAIACVVSSVSVAIARIQPLPGATAVTAAVLLASLPLLCLALRRELSAESGPRIFPEWWWYVTYSAAIFGLMLFAVLLVSFSAPSAIGSLSSRQEPIVAAAAALVALLPQAAGDRPRLAAAWAGAGAVGAVLFATWLSGESPWSLDLIGASGWVLGIAAYNLRAGSSVPPVARPRALVDAIGSIGIVARVSVLAFLATIAVYVDWAIRRLG